MRKLLSLVTVLFLTLSLCLGLTACGDKTPPSEQISSETTSELEFLPTAFGDVTISVPDFFGAVSETQGSYVSAGPNSSIVVTPAIAVELLPTDWDEELVQASLPSLYGASYTDIQFVSFEGNLNLNGNTAVHFTFTGTNAQGIERQVQVIYLFNTELTEQYIITYLTTVGDTNFTPEIDQTIVNSITLAQ